MKLLSLFLTTALMLSILQASASDEAPHMTNSASEPATESTSNVADKQQNMLDAPNKAEEEPATQSTATSQSEAFNPSASLPLRTRLAHIVKGTAKLAVCTGCLLTTLLLYKAVVPDEEEKNPLLDPTPVQPKKENVDGWWDTFDKRLENMNIETSTIQAGFILAFAGPSTLWAAYRLGHSAYASFKTAFSGTPIKKLVPAKPEKSTEEAQTDDGTPKVHAKTNDTEIQPKQAPSNEPAKRKYVL